MRRSSLVLLVGIALLSGACAKDSLGSLAASPSPSSTVAFGPSAPPPGFKALTNDRAPSQAKPTVTIPSEAPPATLQITDLSVGSGAEATAASTVTVNYLLVTWEDKAEIDGSFGGSPLTSALSGLVPGWQQGIPGMKVGGRRQLIIPPELGYGVDPNAHQLGGKTLVFIIDLLSLS